MRRWPVPPDRPRDALLGHAHANPNADAQAAWLRRFTEAERRVRAQHPTWDDRRVEEEAAAQCGRWL